MTLLMRKILVEWEWSQISKESLLGRLWKTLIWLIPEWIIEVVVDSKKIQEMVLAFWSLFHIISSKKYQQRWELNYLKKGPIPLVIFFYLKMKKKESFVKEKLKK